MRPIRPDRSECPRIKKAIRAARFMKWGATPLAGLALIVAIVVGVSSSWYVGLGIFVATWAVLFIVGYSTARCPHCGQVWWSALSMVAFAPWWAVAVLAAEQGDETETYVCRRCRIDIGFALREK
jgi:hypothetical protein